MSYVPIRRVSSWQISFAVCMVALFFGCTGAVEKRQAALGGPTSGKPVDINVFTTDQVASDLPQEPGQFATMTAEAIARSLRERGLHAKVTQGAKPSPDRITIDGQMLVLDSSGYAMRYLVGFFAPAAKVSVDGRVVSGDQVLGQFAVSETGRASSMGGGPDSVFEDAIDAIGEAVADMVLTGDYKRLD